MKTPLPRYAVVSAALLVLSLLAGCSRPDGSQVPADTSAAAATDSNAPQPSSPAGAAKASIPSAKAASGGAGLTLDGEHFTVRKVIDPSQGRLPVAVFVAPEKWVDQSQVVWNYANTSNPVTSATSVENPANAEVTGFEVLA